MSEEREYDDTQHNEAASASTREPSDVSQRGLKASAGPRSRATPPAFTRVDANDLSPPSCAKHLTKRQDTNTSKEEVPECPHE